MTKAEEALYHILCARWKVTNAELTQEELKRVLVQVESLAASLGLMIYGKMSDQTMGVVVQ